MLKHGDRVMLNKSFNEPSVTGKEVQFVNYLPHECRIFSKTLNKLVKSNCIVKCGNIELFSHTDMLSPYKEPEDEKEYGVIVTSDKGKTIATLYINDILICVGVAKCNMNEDKYNFKVGSELAINRMWNNYYAEIWQNTKRISKKYRAKNTKFMVGDIVRVTRSKSCYSRYKEMLTDVMNVGDEIVKCFHRDDHPEQEDKKYVVRSVAKHDLNLIDDVYAIQEIDSPTNNVYLIGGEGLSIVKRCE